MADEIWYVYGVVPASLDATRAPEGLEDAPVRVEPGVRGDLAALVSTLPAATYGTDPLAEHSADMDWLAPRARAHDAVLTWASDRGPVVPLPMFSMFLDAASVRAMLDERRGALETAMERARAGREYVLRVWRLDDQLAAHLGEASERVAELERAAAAASPGQRYLLQRKLDEVRREELKQVGQAVATETFAALRGTSIDAVADPLPAPQPGQPGAAVLNAAFLVAPDGLERFQRALTGVAERRERLGFRFEFTGPWPPYHFVRGAGDGR